MSEGKDFTLAEAVVVLLWFISIGVALGSTSARSVGAGIVVVAISIVLVSDEWIEELKNGRHE